MKNNRRIKLIAASVALMTSFSAIAGLGGLNVQSNLGEPFSGTVTVSGEEAKILLGGGKLTFSDNNLRSSIRKSGENAVVSIRSSRPIQDPVLIFQLSVGSQTRQYTAIIDPPGYVAKREQPSQADRQAAARERVAAVVAAEDVAGTTAGRKPAARSPERRAAAPVRQQERTPARSAMSAQRSGEYTVRQGENLSTIASRVRPGGLSIHQTVQALILANPELFREQSADKIWPGNVVNIPPAAELRRLAQQGVAEPAVVTDVTTPAAASEPTVTPASEPAVVVVPTPASDVAADPASAPVTEAASAEASTPVAVPVPQPAENVEPAADPEGESSGLWRWLLLGGLGLIALWILSKLLGNKQKNIIIRDEVIDEIDAEQSPFDDKAVEVAAKPDDTVIRTEKPVVHPNNSAPLTRAEAAATMGAAIAATAAAKKSKPVEEDGLEIEDDFDDDIFFTEVSEAPPVKSDESISLDLGNLDRQQGGILSSAVTSDVETEQRKDVDWDAIESTDSVYEPEAETGFTPVNVEVPVDTSVEAAVPADKRDFAPLEFEVPVVEGVSESKAVVLETVEGSAAAQESVAEEAWFKEISQDGGIEVQESEDFSAQAAPVDANTEVIEWDDLSMGEESSRDGAGFISESVGMTAPLEAKYELAKMYVEIGDPDAAKETLLDLLEESDGVISAKAKTMLADLEK